MSFQDRTRILRENEGCIRVISVILTTTKYPEVDACLMNETFIAENL